MKLQKPTQKGFTIVELLVVIVVIGVLASITIVAYNGVQARAGNAKTVAAVKAYRDALIQYAIDNGEYPPYSPTCLGTDYPDESIWTLANNNRQCAAHNSSVKVNTSFHDALRPYLSSLPMPSTTIIGDSTNGVRGSFYRNTTPGAVDGGPVQPWHFIYSLQGDVKCPIGPIYSGDNIIGWTSNPATGYSELFTNGTVGVQCRIILPDPATL
jgi:prepilin-type N-terminal cleavage/methylation domain-containing protein